MEEQEVIDHDTLFKRLLRVFYVEFMELFFPDCAANIDWHSKMPVDKEFIGNIENKRKRRKQYADLAMIVRDRLTGAQFIIHIELQEQTKHLNKFPLRMFKYFFALHEEYHLPVLPIVLFSFAKPRKPQARNYALSCANRKVLKFAYEVVQLNRLNWKDYVDKRNPVAPALMAKMPIAQNDRPLVKLNCLNLLRQLLLNDEQKAQIGEFIDAYLNLKPNEKIVFDKLLKESGTDEQVGVTEMVTSWKREGIEEGIEKGIEKGKFDLVIKQLNRKFGALDESFQIRIKSFDAAQLDDLAEALLDFQRLDDLKLWMDGPSSSKRADK